MPATDYTRVTVYLTLDEKDTLERLATNAGLKLGSYIKQQLLGDDMKTTAHTAHSKDFDRETMLTLQDVKNLLHGSGYVVKDVSGRSSYGYDFAIFKETTVEGPITYKSATGDPLLTSFSVKDTEAMNKKGANLSYRSVFSRADVETLLK